MATVRQSDLMYVISTSTDYNYKNLELIVDILNLYSKISGDYENHEEKEDDSIYPNEKCSSR